MINTSEGDSDLAEIIPGDLAEAIQDDLISFIDTRIDLNEKYEDIDFEYDSPLSATAYVNGFDGNITDISIQITSASIDGNFILANFTANLCINLHYSICINGYDCVDGDHFSVGEIEKTFDEEVEIAGSFTTSLDTSGFKGTIDTISYPDIDTYIDPLAELFDELELNDESNYLLNFIQDNSFSGVPIFDSQMLLAQKLLDEVDNSHALNSMIHANIISNLESYLSKKIIPIISSEEYEKIQKTYSNLMTDKTQKIFSINDIVNEQLTPSKIVLRNLIGKSFHDVKFLENLLKKVFNLGIDQEIKDWLNSAVAIRHDCVHRSGYDQSHNPVLVSKESNYTLIENVQLLVQRLEAELPEKIKEKYGYDIPLQDLAIDTKTITTRVC